jgi:hypothetical protein
MNTAPDAVKYEELIEQLSGFERRASSEKIDALEASRSALFSVIMFLETDTRVVERQATRPLWRLWWAIHDQMKGARPRLLFGPRVRRKGAKGAPTYTSAMFLRGFVNLAFIPLLNSGMLKQEAGRWLAGELKRSGIRQPNGTEITASKIIRWRAEVLAKSLRGSNEALAWLIQHERRYMLEKGQLVSDTSIGRSQAQARARGIIRTMRLSGF